MHHKNKKISNNSKHYEERFFELIVFILFAIALGISVYKYKGNGPFVERTLTNDILKISSEGTVILNPDDDSININEDNALVTSLELFSDDSSKAFEINSYNKFSDFSTDIVFSKKNETDFGEVIGRITSLIDEETYINNVTMYQTTKIGEDPKGRIGFDNNSIQIDSRGLIRSSAYIPSISQNAAGCLGLNGINGNYDPKNMGYNFIQVVQSHSGPIMGPIIKDNYESTDVFQRNTTYVIEKWPNSSNDNTTLQLPSLEYFNIGDTLTFLFCGDLIMTDKDIFANTKSNLISCTFKISTFSDDTILRNSVAISNGGGGIVNITFIEGNEGFNYDLSNPGIFNDDSVIDKSPYLLNDSDDTNTLTLINSFNRFYNFYSASGTTITLVKMQHETGYGWAVQAETYSSFAYFSFENVTNS
jgi:hypothetical protein